MAIIPLMPAVTIGARPELVALAAVAPADEPPAELAAALAELRLEYKLAL